MTFRRKFIRILFADSKKKYSYFACGELGGGPSLVTLKRIVYSNLKFSNFKRSRP